MHSASPVVVRAMKGHDASSVARVHIGAFSGYFLTQMGPDFIERYYREHALAPDAYALVATDGDLIAGFLVGTIQGSQVERRFFRRHWPKLAATILAKALTDGHARRSIAARVPVMQRAARAIFTPARVQRSRSKTAPPEEPSGTRASLLSIGVDPGYRGMGVADMLQSAFIDQARRDGVAWLRLNVKPDNQRAVGFYKKTGWRLLRQSDDKITFFLKI